MNELGGRSLSDMLTSCMGIHYNVAFNQNSDKSNKGGDEQRKLTRNIAPGASGEEPCKTACYAITDSWKKCQTFCLICEKSML